MTGVQGTRSDLDVDRFVAEDRCLGEAEEKEVGTATQYDEEGREALWGVDLMPRHLDFH